MLKHWKCRIPKYFLNFTKDVREYFSQMLVVKQHVSAKI